MNDIELTRMRTWLENHPLRKWCDMEQGLSPQKYGDFDKARHESVVHQVALAYQKAKEKQSSAPLEYLPNKMWEANIRLNRADLTYALNNDVDKLGDMLANFWRNSCAGSLIKYPTYAALTDNKDGATMQEYFLVCLLKDLMAFAEYNENQNISNLSIPYIGNPYGCMFKDYLLTGATLSNRYYADKLGVLLNDIEYPIVAEIGGGIGLLAYFMLRHNPNLRYMNFDLPEVLAVNQYYLMMALPDKKFKLFGDACNEFDIALLPNFCLPEVETASCDMVINIHSLSEMKPDTVREYLNQIQRICRKYFYMENSVVGQEYNETPIGNVKFDPSFRRVYKSPAIWSEPIYREFLFERIV